MCPAPALVNSASSEAKDDTAKPIQLDDGSNDNQIDLKSCTPESLAKYLLENRFYSNGAKGVAFLQAAIQAMEKDSKMAASSHDSSPAAAAATDVADLGAPLLTMPLETSVLTPRAGKCSIQFYEKGMVATRLKDQTDKLVIPSGNVSHTVIFAKPEDCQHICKGNPKPPSSAHLVLLQLSEEVEFQGKPVSQVSFALSYEKKVGPTGPKLVESNSDEEVSGWKDVTAAWRKVLEQSLGSEDDNDSNAMVVAQVHPNAPSPFKSHQAPGTSTTTGGLPFVRCYHGVQDGVLYPLEEGLLFYKYVFL